MLNNPCSLTIHILKPFYFLKVTKFHLMMCSLSMMKIWIRWGTWKRAPGETLKSKFPPRVKFYDKNVDIISLVANCLFQYFEYIVDPWSMQHAQEGPAQAQFSEYVCDHFHIWIWQFPICMHCEICIAIGQSKKASKVFSLSENTFGPSEKDCWL